MSGTVRPRIRAILLIWLGWASVMLAFQQWVVARIDLRRPDRVLYWTAPETGAGSQSDKPYLLDPFLNQHVSWDSEFYLSIATVGYDDPAVRAVPSDFARDPLHQHFCQAGKDTDCYSLNYAFFPLYPWLTRAVASPLDLLPLTPIARSTLAAMLVSLLGALGAMLSLYFMTRAALGEEGATRAAFYLLIFPSGFFLAQVYTEGLFLGLSFGALALLQARKWGWSALLAALAAWTRPGGAILLLPMAMVWMSDRPWRMSWGPAIRRGLAALTPAMAYGAWSLTPLATRFDLVEKLWFGRGLLAISPSLRAWEQALQLLLHGSPQTRFYYGLEFGAVLLAIATCLLLWRERPELSAYGLAMIAFALTSGSAQGMVRYVLVVPSLFWTLARWGRNSAFDRTWSLLSILLLGLETTLFSFDFWVA